eukprot:TRINITY_DN8452_c0_g1_i2.p1 TRINITY_DN8452_c0_g1~~TRINITY_DN8452_c0_g1_i2.p1  ORF type:complete len:154 (-),score=30.15 TRINITY_DN8452_c0_g1_i2:19-480(-)
MAWVGDMKVDAGLHLEALSIYVRCVSNLKSVLLIARATPTPSLGMSNVMSVTREKLQELLYKCKNVKSKVKPYEEASPVEFILYNFALQLGREAAVQELLQNVEKSLGMYSEGLTLLEYLLSESPSSQDRDLLRSFVADFGTRITSLRNMKQT